MDTHIKECRICYLTDNSSNLISPCLCDGTSKYVHGDCLFEWLNTTDSEEAKIKCMECNYKYKYKKVRCIQFYNCLNTKLKYNVEFIFFCISMIINLIFGYCIFYSNNKNYKIVTNKYILFGSIIQLVLYLFCMLITISYIKCCSKTLRKIKLNNCLYLLLCNENYLKFSLSILIIIVSCIFKFYLLISWGITYILSYTFVDFLKIYGNEIKYKYIKKFK